jgi:hypothetical protein
MPEPVARIQPLAVGQESGVRWIYNNWEGARGYQLVY